MFSRRQFKNYQDLPLTDSTRIRENFNYLAAIYISSISQSSKSYELRSLSKFPSYMQLCTSNTFDGDQQKIGSFILLLRPSQS